MKKGILLALACLAFSQAPQAQEAAKGGQAQAPAWEQFPSGMKMAFIKKGQGPVPTQQDTVEVNYRGTLENGFEFDSSYKAGKSAVFPLRGVIPCWTEAVSKMPVGSKAQVYCPASLAYGQRGVPGLIPPGAPLIFEVELLGIAGRK